MAKKWLSGNEDSFSKADWEAHWRVSMFDNHIHRGKLLRVYCPGHAGVKGNDRAKAGKATNKRLKSRKVLSIEELEIGLAGSRPRVIAPLIGGRRREVRKEEALDDLP